MVSEGTGVDRRSMIGSLQNGRFSVRFPRLDRAVQRSVGFQQTHSTVALPCEVKADQVKASFKNGVLEVRMPKTEEAKKKAVTVKID
jgi:HSP20 family protein